MGILEDIGFSGIRSQVQGSLPQNTISGGSQQSPSKLSLQGTNPFSGFKLPPNIGFSSGGPTRDGSFPNFPQEGLQTTGFYRPFAPTGVDTSGPGPLSLLQDKIAQMQQNAPRNPFLGGGFPNFPSQGQQPSFGNPFFTGDLPQGLNSTKNL